MAAMTSSPGDYRAKGSDLERRIEAYFAQNGYDAHSNVFRTGRSGATHEIDVLATKSDGVLAFSVLVECKAWEGQVAKETVSKLSLVMNDVGVNKAIIVSLRGWTTGAELTAKQFGIELWGTEELRDKLGSVAIAEISSGHSVRVGRGFAPKADENAVKTRLMTNAAGFLGLGREELVWIKLVWLPFFLVTVDHSKVRPTLMRGRVTESATRWNIYDGLSGALWQSFAGPPGLDDVVLGTTVPPVAQTRKLQREINDALAKARSVVTPKARERHLARVAALGIPPDSEEALVTSSETIAVPFYCALLRSAGTRRVSAIDAYWGARWPSVDAALSANVQHVIAAAGEQPNDEAQEFASLKGSQRSGRLTTVVVLAVCGGATYLLAGFDASRFIQYFLALGVGLLLILFVRWRLASR